MASQVLSGTLVGVDALGVEVEVDLVRRLPRTTIVGLAASAVQESVERVRSAIGAAGLEYPRYRVTVNLAPADLRKEGTGFDLPIAVAILGAAGVFPPEATQGLLFSGELSLAGELRPTRGALSLALLAKERGCRAVVLPRGAASQAAVVPDLVAFEAQTLEEVVDFLRGQRSLGSPSFVVGDTPWGGLDLAEVQGQAMARRALEIAAAGGHNLLFVGPPGVGKTMLASRLPGILPSMSFQEALECTQVHSAAGLLPSGVSLLQHRPFRAPHHSISAAGLIGGASLRPGELSLAHNGVLFLDELPEFQRGVLEQLRGPLEDRELRVSRAQGTVRFPAGAMLVAAANPCPCGYRGHPLRPCRCGDADVARYLGRLSGPLLDRIDIFIRAEPLSAPELLDPKPSEASAVVRERVEVARRRQAGRASGLSNAALVGRCIRDIAAPTSAADRLLGDAVERHFLSGRGRDRVLKVARTIADLDGSPRVDARHVAEALAFRSHGLGLEAA